MQAVDVLRLGLILHGGSVLEAVTAVAARDAARAPVDEYVQGVFVYFVDHGGVNLIGFPEMMTMHAKELLAALQKDGRGMAVVIADIDHFKRLNDTYGHPVGDRALQAFSHALSTHARPSDIVARLGGEEFVMVLPDASSEGACHVVERIRSGLPAVLSSSGVPPLTASFGIADRRHGETLDALLRSADQALYSAKDAGRDRFQVA